MQMPSEIREMFLNAFKREDYNENTIFEIHRGYLNVGIKNYMQWLIKLGYAELVKGSCVEIPYRFRLTGRWFENHELSDL